MLATVRVEVTPNIYVQTLQQKRNVTEKKFFVLFTFTTETTKLMKERDKYIYIEDSIILYNSAYNSKVRRKRNVITLKITDYTL